MPDTTGTTTRLSASAFAMLLMLCCALPAIAQTSTNQGREFWVVFQKNFRDHVTDAQTGESRPAHPLTLELQVSAVATAKGYVEIPSIRFRRDFVVQPNQVLRIPIDTTAQLRGSETIEKLGVHVVVDAPITLTGLNRRYQTTETWLGLPVEALGTTYRAVGYAWLQDDLLSQLAIVATEDGTEVTITPSVPTRGGRSEAFVVRLDRGEVYQVIAKFDPNTKSDLTGTLVTSTRPVAVFSGHNCAYVPDKRVKACNLLVEQLPPVSAWSNSFVVVPLADRARSRYRVVASDDNTEIRANGVAIATLKAGDYHEADLAGGGPISLLSSRPVMVVQFSTGYDDDTPLASPVTRRYISVTEEQPVDSAAIRRRITRDSLLRDSLRKLSQQTTDFDSDTIEAASNTIVSAPSTMIDSESDHPWTLREARQVPPPVETTGIGDPMMILVPATTAYLTEYRIHTPVAGKWHHFINVIASADAVETLRIDGLAFDVDKASLATLFKPVGTSGWFSAQIEIGEGAHYVTASAPIGIYQYGFSAYDAYGNSAGGSMAR